MANLKQSVANTILDNTASGLYLGLATTSPTATSNGTEISGNGYARQAISFAAASAGTKAQSATVTFPAASGAQGTAVAWVLWTALTGGTQVAWKPITPIAINNGDQVTLPSATVNLSLS